MLKLIVKWLLSASALLFVAYVYSGVQVGSFASAMIAALVIGLFFGRSQGLKLATLGEAAAQGTPSADVKAQIAAAGSRVALTSRLVALLLLLSVVSMGVFRYVSAVPAP